MEFLRLHESQDFDKLIQSAEATRKDLKADAVFGQHNFARVEIFKIQRESLVRIGLLLMLQHDIETDADAAGLEGTAVGRLHDTRPPTSGDRNPALPSAFPIHGQDRSNGW